MNDQLAKQALQIEALELLLKQSQESYKMCEAEYMKYKNALREIFALTSDAQIEKIIETALEPGALKANPQ